jgi:hypothetical protein
LLHTNYKFIIEEHIEDFAEKFLIKKEHLEKHQQRVQKEIKSSISFILSTLIKRHFYEKDIQYKSIYIPHSPNSYVYDERLKDFNFTAVKKSVEILKEHNIIKKTDKTGYAVLEIKNPTPQKYKYNHKKKIISIYTLNEFDNWNISAPLEEIIKLIYISKKNNTLNDCAIIKHLDKKGSRQIKEVIQDEDLNYINNYLRKIGREDLLYKRVFFETTDQEGRYYNYFQRIKKEIRKEICEQNDWVELDYQAMAPNILYLKETGKKYDGDPYQAIIDYLEIPDEYRSIIKRIFNISINTENKNQAINTIRSYLIEECGIYLPKNEKHKKLEINDAYRLGFIDEYTFNQAKERFKLDCKHYLLSVELILEAIESSHKEISNLLYSKTYYFTQSIESKVISKLMRKMIDMEILPLSIHDCIIVPSQYETFFKQYMEECLISALYRNINYIVDYISYNNINSLFIKNNNIFYNSLFNYKYLYIYKSSMNQITPYSTIMKSIKTYNKNDEEDFP